MNEEEIIHKFIQGIGKKGGLARAKNTTKEQRIKWGKLGSDKRWAK